MKSGLYNQTRICGAPLTTPHSSPLRAQQVSLYLPPATASCPASLLDAPGCSMRGLGVEGIRSKQLLSLLLVHFNQI